MTKPLPYPYEDSNIRDKLCANGYHLLIPMRSFDTPIVDILKKPELAAVCDLPVRNASFPYADA